FPLVGTGSLSCRRHWLTPFVPATGWLWPRTRARCCMCQSLPRPKTPRAGGGWLGERLRRPHKAPGGGGRPCHAFGAMGQVSDEQISRFFDQFAARLADDAAWAAIARANDDDVARAKAKRRSTTRLVAGE